jgi:hypothetical protein
MDIPQVQGEGLCMGGGRFPFSPLVQEKYKSEQQQQVSK